MTLDDRSLREHLDRRAGAGASDVEGIAELVMARVTSIERRPWWRRIGVRGPAVGVAVAALVVLAVAVSVLPPPSSLEPAASPSDPGPAGAEDYPADRALDVMEFDAVLGSDPAERAGQILIASLTLETRDMFCYGTECPRYVAILDGREIGVYDPEEAEPELPGPGAFRVRTDGALDLLGHVRSGPEGLAWTLPQLTAALPELRAADRAVPYLYLVDAWRDVSTSAYRCLATVLAGDPDFGCGTGVAWLVEDEASLPSDSSSAPRGSLRVPNVAPVGLRLAIPHVHGHWLVDPFVPQDEATCFLCPPAGAADLLGSILTLDELESAPPEATTPPVGGYPTDRALTAPEVAGLVAGFTGDGRYVAIVVEADMVPIDPLPVCLGDYACPTWEIPVPGFEAIAIWATAGFAPNPDGPDAFTIVSDSDGPSGRGLAYVGPVVPGPEGIIWSLPQLLSALPSLEPDGDVPFVYVVEAERVSTPNPTPCPSMAPEPEPTFDCRSDLAWLVPEGTSLIDPVNGPGTGIRVPGAPSMLDSLERRQSGLWLIDPVQMPSVCLGCPPAGAAAMIGRVPSLEELVVTP